MQMFIILINNSKDLSSYGKNTRKEIIKFLKENIEPINHPNYGIGYRASAYLVDGTYLPCVIFRNSKIATEHAMRRFREEQTSKNETKYYDIVKIFVTHGNCINSYDISKVSKSKFAFPLSVLSQIQGETRMGSTSFVAKMKDGNHFSYGTSFFMEFFDVPQEYSAEDIDEIVNHSYVSKLGEIRSCYAPVEKPTDKRNDLFFRERPFFECYLDDL